MAAGQDAFAVLTSLRQARIASGMTQDALAGRIGCSPSRVSEWENGHVSPSMAMLFRWADALGGRIVCRLGDGA